MNRSAYAVISTGIIIVLAAALLGVLIFMNNQPAPARGVAPLIEIAEREPDSALWGINFPNQYSTYLQTEENNTRTAYGGSYPFDKLEENPRLRVLFAGYGFSKEYNEDRGHMWSLHDVNDIARINETSFATCYSCKSSDNPRLWHEMGKEGYEQVMFYDMSPEMNHPIGCANCHEANTMRLVVTNPALEKALEIQGKDWRTFTRQEMRTVVCANCHVEYYFKGGNALTFPWHNGTRVEDMSAYFEEVDFADWTHPDSGAPMIKMQHPEYELYTADSTHYKAGVSCADCHMPYTRDGAAKFSSHNKRSPLLNPQHACGTCHTDPEYVVGRVAVIQDQVWERMEAAEIAIVDAIDSIKSAASTTGFNEEMLNEARWLHREAQLRWDYVAAENSMGFHNPSEALRILGDATDIARQAQLKAVLAAGKSSSLQAGQPSGD
jgi:nitrite reductase (cytochrome c-552)